MSKDNIVLQSNDGQTFEVDLKIAKVSNTIKNMLDLVDFKNGDVIPFENINGYTLNKIVVWMTHHKDDEPIPEPDDSQPQRSSDDITAWDKQFLEFKDGFTHEKFVELTLIANFLAIPELLCICCMTVANMIKTTKDPEAIRALFEIENDLTQEEVEEIIKKNPWAPH